MTEEQIYIPSVVELAEEAYKRTKPATRKLASQVLFNPLLWPLLIYRCAETRNFANFARYIANSFFTSTPNQRTLGEMQQVLSETFYCAIQSLAFRNLSFGQNDLTEKLKINQQDGYPQVPGDTQLSIISDSRERFNRKAYALLGMRMPFKDYESFLGMWNQEFFDYVSENQGFEHNGNFFLQDGKVLYRAGFQLPPKPPIGGAIAVGGIAAEPRERAKWIGERARRLEDEQ
jgi:hypothetical protein